MSGSGVLFFYKVPVQVFFFFFLKGSSFFKIYFIYLFLAALGHRFRTWAFSSCSERGLLFVVVRGFSLQWLLLLQSTGSRHAGSVVVACGLSSCGARA